MKSKIAVYQDRDGMFVDEDGFKWLCRCSDCGVCYNPGVETPDVHEDNCPRIEVL